MINVLIRRGADGLAGFRVSGHSGYAEAGRDIVCAAVSSAVSMTVNGITEILGAETDLAVDERSATVDMLLKKGSGRQAEVLIEIFEMHIRSLREQYPKYISLTYLEV